MRLGLNPGSKLTGAMARKTFATLGDRLFKLRFITAPWEELMKVTHHLSRMSFKDYVTECDWKDLNPYRQAHSSNGNYINGTFGLSIESSTESSSPKYGFWKYYHKNFWNIHVQK